MLFDVIPDNFFIPLSSPNRRVYWECLTEVFSITGKQLSFGVERDIVTDRLEYYFDQDLAADFAESDEDPSCFMDPSTYRENLSAGKPLTGNDRKTLTTMITDPFFSSQISLFEEMLRSGIKEEQECLENVSGTMQHRL